MLKFEAWNPSAVSVLFTFLTCTSLPRPFILHKPPFYTFILFFYFVLCIIPFANTFLSVLCFFRISTNFLILLLTTTLRWWMFSRHYTSVTIFCIVLVMLTTVYRFSKNSILPELVSYQSALHLFFEDLLLLEHIWLYLTKQSGVIQSCKYFPVDK